MANSPDHRPPGGWTVPQALAEIEHIAKAVERLPRHVQRHRVDRWGFRDDVASIRRACRNLRQDVRGLARLLEPGGKRSEGGAR